MRRVPQTARAGVEERRLPFVPCDPPAHRAGERDICRWPCGVHVVPYGALGGLPRDARLPLLSYQGSCPRREQGRPACKVHELSRAARGAWHDDGNMLEVSLECSCRGSSEIFGRLHVLPSGPRPDRGGHRGRADLELFELPQERRERSRISPREPCLHELPRTARLARARRRRLHRVPQEGGGPRREQPRAHGLPQVPHSTHTEDARAGV